MLFFDHLELLTCTGAFCKIKKTCFVFNDWIVSMRVTFFVF